MSRKNLVASWVHHDDMGSGNKLAVVSDLVVIPDRVQHKLILYSLDGRPVKSLSLEIVKGGLVSICALDSHTVVVSDNDSQIVSRVNVTTGDILWSHRVDKPEGVACYECEYVLVASHTSNTIKVLEAEQGEADC